MTVTSWVLLAAATALGIKLSGYLLPKSLLERPEVIELAGIITIGLLASLTVLNTLTVGQSLQVDSRLLALLAAGIALKLKAPYLVVVLIGALTAALGRLCGLP